MDYTPEDLNIYEETPPPKVEPPPDPPTPETPDTGGVGEETPCPGPAQLRVGDVTQSGDEKVVGHELVKMAYLCDIVRTYLSNRKIRPTYKSSINSDRTSSGCNSGCCCYTITNQNYTTCSKKNNYNCSEKIRQKNYETHSSRYYNG